MAVYRTYVEKKPEFSAKAAGLLADLREELSMDCVTSLRIVNRYDVEGIDPSILGGIRRTVFGEPAVDIITDALEYDPGDTVFAVSYLSGQYDQRADSCEQCIQLVTRGARPRVRTAKIYIISGVRDPGAVKKYLINPVDSREVGLEPYETLYEEYPVPPPPEIFDGFRGYSPEQLEELRTFLGLAMDSRDLEFCREYFAREGRDPTITEIRMIDTYWSDHCRHTTFMTRLEKVTAEDPETAAAYERYLKLRREVYGDEADSRPVTLMDIATIGSKYLKKAGLLTRQDSSDEINACCVKIEPEIDGKPEPWLLMFKNETHNHPTEIEPFGGAATCLGGAIRDPLSGRSYCYQAMRVTGAADPRTPYSETLPDKLAQRKICRGAAAGFSSYGNQIGLATGIVAEVYHPGYAAKRLETGAVIAAAPSENVVRSAPVPGDIVMLVGGRTGRDGCGGATGSSKSHDAGSIHTCGAEVQKGNPPEERKIQRLFRSPECSRMIRRCNDFGAGGVCVAIGELADGLDIDLDAVPKKYEGLSATELAISESQERMAVVVSPENAAAFAELAAAENLSAVPVATVTADAELTLRCGGRTVARLSREFIDSNGAPKTASVLARSAARPAFRAQKAGFFEKLRGALGRLNCASQKGLSEFFDSTVGAGAVFMPFGGKYRGTPQQAMVSLLPLLSGESGYCSVMAYGFDPEASEKDPLRAAACAVISSVAKTIAAGAEPRRDGAENCWLSLQEFFPSPRKDPERWALPFKALLGALDAQIGLGIGAIGGKDSMSGSFSDIDVPPTLISFAVSTSDADNVISCELKAPGHYIYLIAPPMGPPDYKAINAVFSKVSGYIKEKKILAAYSLTECGLGPALCKMSFGNRIGIEFASLPCDEVMFGRCVGGFAVESDRELDGLLIGRTVAEPAFITADGKIPLKTLLERWEAPLEQIYPTKAASSGEPVRETYSGGCTAAPNIKTARPTVFIPVFPGTNCEYDMGKRFEEAGARVLTEVVRNLTADDVERSAEAMARGISQSQILAIPGGFSGGDEPDGSGKFITAFFVSPVIRAEIDRLICERGGLALGICNGFQALVKLGLVPFGRITPMTDTSPTLTFNTIGRHQSMPVRLRVMSNRSPWLKHAHVGQIYTVPISHGEGRFAASEAAIGKMARSGQIATVYCDENGEPTMDMPHNPNGSAGAIEGITSADGRIFGKMGHDERCGKNLLKNVGGSDLGIFAAGVEFFR